MTGLYDPRGLQSPPTDQGTAMRCDLLKPAKKMTKDQERAAFLDWHNNRRSSNQNAWAAWQARASLVLASDDPRDGMTEKPAAWIRHSHEGGELEWTNKGGNCTPLYRVPLSDADRKFFDTFDSIKFHRWLAFYDVIQERSQQDAQWGGPEHDDKHDAADFAEYIRIQLGRMTEDECRVRLVKVAALAVAAIESLDRKARI